MGIEKLQRLAELDEERKDLARRLGDVERTMEQLIGAGFEVAGAIVKPKKKWKKTQTETVAPSSDGFSRPLPSLSTDSSTVEESAKPSVSLQQTIVDLLDAHADERWSAPQVAERVGCSLGQANNGMYWLFKQGKIHRVIRGLYQSPKSAPRSV